MASVSGTIAGSLASGCSQAYFGGETSRLQYGGGWHYFFLGVLCVPHKAIVKMEILREAHRTPYMVHPGETKMYQDLKQRGGSG